jgi:hypothetical protein
MHMLNDYRDVKTEMTWKQLPDRDTVERTLVALQANGVDAQFVETVDEARQKIRELVPEGAEVMNMTSQTLEATGIAGDILQSGRYAAVRNQWAQWDRAAYARERRRMGAAPEWAIGSVQAVTEHGQTVMASATGSQMAAYTYGAAHVVWVVGVQKIVKDLDAALSRVSDYVQPAVSDIVLRTKGVPGPSVNKLLIFNKEVQPGRITLILVNEALGI